MKKLIYIFILLLALETMGFCAFRKSRLSVDAQPQSSVVVDWGDPINIGLMHYWLMNEGAGSNNYDLVSPLSLVSHGTTAWGIGRNGVAFNYNGSGRYSSVTDSRFPTSPTKMTVVAWVNPTSGAEQSIISQRNSSGWLWAFGASGTTQSVYNGSFQSSNSGAVTFGKWNNLALTYTSTGTLWSFYTNGAPVGTTSVAIQAGTGVWNLGWWDNGVTGAGNSLTQNVRVYNRVLSPSEISRLYTEPYAGLVSPRRWILSPHPSAYSYYRTITVDHTKVSNTDQTQFPILVCANGSSPCNATVSGMNQSGGGAHVQNSNGYDIIFTTDSACSTPLTWEMEKYVASTGEFEAWVTNTSTALSHTADTVFYMCYGNSVVSSFQSTASSVWDTSYKGVYHFPNGTSLTANDSTTGGFNGTLTNTPTATTGQIDGAANIASASSQSITMGNNLNIGATDFTLEAWINPVNATSVGPIIAKGVASGAQYSLTQGFLNSGGTFTSSKKVGIFVWNGVGFPSGAQGYHTTNDVVDGNWHHVVATRTGGVIAIYIDGTSVSLTSDFIKTTSVDPTSTASLFFGKDYSTDLYNGKIDEARISTSLARNADWILTEFNNGNNPNNGTGQFYSMGTEIATSSGNVTSPLRSFSNALFRNLVIN